MGKLKRTYFKIFLSVLIVSVFFTISIIIPSHAIAEINTAKVGRVLFLNQNSPSYFTYSSELDGIISIFSEELIKIDEEFMDLKRLSSEADVQNFYQYIKYKLNKLSYYDVIIVSGNEMLEFALKYQEELFKDKPIVFMCVNDLELAQRAGGNSYITGVIEQPSLNQTLELAKKFNPEASNVIGIVDDTRRGKQFKELYLDMEGDFEGLSFEIIDLGTISFDELENELKQVDSDDIVMFFTADRDKNKERIPVRGALEFMAKYSSQPVYVPYEYGVGEGVLGGMVVSTFEQGRAAASLSLEIINGREVSEIECIQESPNRYVLDYNLINKYGIDKNLIPKDAVLLNKELTIFEQYLGYIGAALILIIVEAILIVYLRLNIRKRKLTEAELLMNREELVITNNELSASLEEVRAQSEQINDLIYIDALTGLNNRFSILQIIDQILCENEKQGILAVMFLDMDNFKDINDTHGHDVGDRIIQYTGERLKGFENDCISIGRFGGDEFVIVLKNQGKIEDIVAFIDQLKGIFSKQLEVNKHAFFLTFSIGVAINCIDDSSEVITRSSLMKKADLALYKAKDAGKNTYVFYDESMKIAIEEKTILQSAIKKAFEKREFFLHYQPVINTKTKKISGFEALIRWVSSEHGYVSPYKLIRYAEEMGLIVEIGDWVLREACKFAKEINDESDTPFTVSANVSAVQLMDYSYYDRTMAIIEEVGVKPEWICLEMTETVLIESMERGINLMERLKDQGFSIALDDFGTGYSSLSYFKDLPATILKIDKNFVDNVCSSEYDGSLIHAMVTIAHNKGVGVVAEGVETWNQFNVIDGYDCDFIQGYLFSKPLGKEEALALIND